MHGRARPVARLEDVTQRYASTVALDAITLELPAGCMVGLIGPDGVGKSSLLGIIAGARQIQSGQVFVLDGDMADPAHRAAVCPRIAYMPQGLGKNLYPDLSVRENIEFFSRLFGQSRSERERRIAELLASTGLAPFADRPAKKLSGGMRQKLGLVLLADPRSRSSDTRRADDRRRPAVAPPILGADRPHPVAPPRHERHRRDRVYGRGRAVRLARRHERREECWRPAPRRNSRRKPGARRWRMHSSRCLPEAAARRSPRLHIPPRRIIDTEPVIAARGLTCRFGDFTAVDQVSFTIERGEIFGFVGSNGCGKTTTMKMLTGLLPPAKARRCCSASRSTRSDMNSRNRVGYMSQSFSLYTELTVRQNLDLHARLFHLPARKARRVLPNWSTASALTDYLDQRALDLPLGIRQRLSLAVAIVHEPEMLILDEPTSGVDPLGARPVLGIADRSVAQSGRDDLRLDPFHE